MMAIETDRRMPEINPYEPPKSASKPTRRLRQGVGVAIILLLTPPAMVIAVAGTCRMLPSIPGSGIPFACGVPLLVLTGLMVTAAVLDRPRRGDPNSRPSRAAVLLGTPPVVAIAGFFAICIAAVLILASPTLSAYEASMRTAPLIVWTITGAALLGMLLLAWRAGR